MARVKDLAGDVETSDNPIVIVVAVPPVTDVDPRTRREPPLTTHHLEEYARMGLDIAFFCLVLVDFYIASLHPCLHSLKIVIFDIAIVASMCGLLSCMVNYDPNPSIKKTLSLTFIISIISIVITFAMILVGRKESVTDLTMAAYIGIVTIEETVSVLKFLAVVFYFHLRSSQFSEFWC